MSNGKFSYPSSTATDGDGNVYVVDSDNERIQKFTSSGTFLTKWGSWGNGDGEFSSPYGIATDQSGYVYVTDTGNNRIQKFSGDGTFLGKWGSYGGEGGGGMDMDSLGVSTLAYEGMFDYPLGIATDSSSNVYVVDSNNNRIQKFSSNGGYLTQWGDEGRDDGAGSGAGQLNSPYSVTTDANGNIYVADTYNSRIQKFSSSGVYVSQWGAVGSGNGQFDEPQGIAIDSTGNIYVADTYNSRIQKFSNNGTYLMQWGGYGSGDGEFSEPTGLAVDTSDNVYVADYQNSRIQKFSSNGDYLTQWGGYGDANGEFAYAAGVAVDASGAVYVLDTNNNRIQKFSSNGDYLTQWGEYGGSRVIPFSVDARSGVSALDENEGMFAYPRGIAVDSGDNVYVADTGNGRIQKFSSDGSYLTQWGTPSGGGGFDARSSTTVTAISQDGSEFADPSGITVDTAGNVYVADTDNNRIQKFGYPKSAELESPSGSQDIQLSTPAATDISHSDVVTEASLEQQDQSNTFPLGLVDFELTAPTGSTQQITLTFETDLTPGDVTARKYHSTSRTYSDVTSATIRESTLDGKHALQLTYDITDGGSLDDDGLANGTIVDPVGLAVANDAAAPGAPNSGAGMMLSLPVLASVVVIPVLAYVAKKRRSFLH